MSQGKIQTCVVDPVSPEFNRGSFCYSPYLLFCSADQGGKVLFENFCAADIDALPEADEYLIALWSHPQIEHVLTLLRFLPRDRCKVFGYSPLIRSLGMPLYILSEQTLLDGMRNYIRFQTGFDQILLSDCDMHLKKYLGQVYPMFTSYGCPNGCAFCPSTANQSRRVVLPVEDVIENLRWMGRHGHTCIHFTDEDLFFDTGRALMLCQEAEHMEYDFQFIALVERRSLSRFINKAGTGLLERAGFKLLEVGLETASENLSKEMGKPGGGVSCAQLAESCSVPILWLTLTFFPGETIETLKHTGDFLRQYGQRPEDLYSRIATNSTVGGLGQFFQPYEGTKGFGDLEGKGVVLTNRPLRLMPSFVPFSFLHDIITEARAVREEERIWYDMYHVDPPPEYWAGETIGRAAVEGWPSPVDGYIALAISARLGVIQ